MNKPTDDLDRELRQDVFRRRTFNEASMAAIERRIAAGNGVKAGGTDVRRKVWMTSVASAAAILIVAVTLLLSGQGADWFRGTDPGKAEPPLPTETSTPSPTIEPGETDNDTYIQVDATSGKLGEQLPFSTEHVQSITIKLRMKEQRMIGETTSTELTVPQSRAYLFLQNLHWTDLEKAIAHEPSPTDSGVVIRLHTQDGVYAIPYDVDSNTYELGDDRYYADNGVAQLMHSLLRPESPLATMERLSARASQEMEQSEATVDESFGYGRERFDVAGKDFNGWFAAIGQDNAYRTIVRYYDSIIEEVAEIRYDQETGIMATQGEIVFLNDTVKTVNGIKVGLTKDQVTGLLGKANLELDSKWSYKLGDYLKFHLYFENGRVACISLTMPA